VAEFAWHSDARIGQMEAGNFQQIAIFEASMEEFS
jgi:hypothetical protein